MTQRFIRTLPGASIPLPTWVGLREAVHVFDEASVLALNAALATGRPLLVRGEPGTGKSQLARAAAADLARVFLVHTVDAHTETRDILWNLDAISRLAEAQLQGALRPGDAADAREAVEVRRFVEPRSLWWAFDWEHARKQATLVRHSEPERPEGWDPARGAVLLIDEIDKADPSVPNGLLDALGNERFDTPVGVVTAKCRPLVVITTNEERALPDAFLRRCLVLPLALPTARDELLALLVARGKAHDAGWDTRVLWRAAELLADDRAALANLDLALPGTAEYLDLLRAVTVQLPGDIPAQLALLEKVARFALRKHPAGTAR